MRFLGEVLGLSTGRAALVGLFGIMIGTVLFFSDAPGVSLMDPEIIVSLLIWSILLLTVVYGDSS